MPIVSVGAAFALLGGRLPQAPAWMQRRGLEWFFRLCVEPRRLWRRYVFLNPVYVFLVGVLAVGLFDFDTGGREPAIQMLHG
jgi:N-acetylglucosaminyldiphosphoundecaprenol N-acetyl-beta-D-mannosaminyltransferase